MTPAIHYPMIRVTRIVLVWLQAQAAAATAGLGISGYPVFWSPEMMWRGERDFYYPAMSADLSGVSIHIRLPEEIATLIVREGP